MTGWIHMIELVLESTYQFVSDDIYYIPKQKLLIEIQVY